jgi:hypothetical protein
LAAAAAALPKTHFKHGLPLATLPDRVPGPDWIVRGKTFAHDTS